jgi:hypothetical protein
LNKYKSNFEELTRIIPKNLIEKMFYNLNENCIVYDLNENWPSFKKIKKLINAKNAQNAKLEIMKILLNNYTTIYSSTNSQILTIMLNFIFWLKY